MQCPKCGNENPDDAQVCGSCSFIWPNPNQTKPGASKRNWVLPVIGVLLMGLSAGLAVFIKPTWAFAAALLAFCSLIADIRTNWNRRKVKGRAIGAAILIMSFLQMLALSYLRIDAAPIPDDYTINDLRSAPPECSQTYELLGQLTDVDLNVQNVSPIGLSAQEIRRLEEIHDLCKEKDLQTVTLILQDNANDITAMWQHAKKGREVITKLKEFPEIADLGEPSLEIRRSWFVSLRHLAHLHRMYICLESSRGNSKTAVDTLLEYDSFIGKLSLNSRSTIATLVCIASSAVAINTANFITNNPDTPGESLLLLRQHMIPLSRERTSLRNTLMSEYLLWKKEFTKMSDEVAQKYKYRSFSPLKLNSTLRLCRNFADELIATEEGLTQTKKFKVWPALYPTLPVKIGRDGRLPLYYRIYNPFATAVIELFAPAIYRVRLIRTRLQVHSDLVKIVLDKRLGGEVSLKARAYSDEYIVDVENRRVLSPGPDGKAGTKDDIMLPINPEVLGW